MWHQKKGAESLPRGDRLRPHAPMQAYRHCPGQALACSVQSLEQPPLAEDVGELVTPGGTVALGVFGGADDEGDGVLAGVGHADVDGGEGDALGAGGGAAVEIDEGLAAVVWEDLDLAPGNAAGAGAEGLHDGLFGGEAGRELPGSAAAEGDFEGRVDAAEEAVAEFGEGGLDASDLDDVDANGGGCHVGMIANSG